MQKSISTEQGSVVHRGGAAADSWSTRRWRQRLRGRYGPWALVTGASDGIGRACAVELARAGMNLVLAARRKDLLEQLARELEDQHGVEARSVVVDLASPQGVGLLLRETSSLDVGLVIASAGFGTSGSFVEGALPAELQMIDVNCRAVAEMAHGFSQRLVKRGGGGLVFLSSLVAFQGVPRAANYAATKAYVQSLAEALYHELKPRGVDVLACAPGPVHSGFAARAAMTMTMAQTPDEVARGALRALGYRSTVRPGFLAKALELSLKLLPRWGRVRVMALVMAGMTRGHA
ncbi:MAG: SDR family oxidoreductase [Polyangiaceae bacterium]|nr:SDR family oxidoreductase [Polyangiaceae bacterium]